MTTATKIVNEVTLDASANPNVDTTFIDKGTNENTAHDIHGNSGKDTWVSGPGQNNFDGGDGIDTASYIHSQSGVTVDLNVGFAFSDDGKITDNLSSVENVVGSKFADNLTGAFDGSHINGGLGGDVMTGGEGGKNTFEYGNWHDSYNAPGHMDEITNFKGGPGGDVIDLSALDKAMHIPTASHNLMYGTAPTSVGDIGITYDGTHTFVEERVDGNALHDLRIELDGTVPITHDNFHF